MPMDSQLSAKCRTCVCVLSALCALFYATHSITPSYAATGEQHKSRYISYFSPEGRVLAKRYKIPRPPIIILGRDKLDPPRTVSARKWNGHFCRRWDDGFTECERANPTAKAVCYPISSPTPEDICTKRTVRCSSEWTVEVTATVCRRLESEERHFLDGKPLYTTYSQSESIWKYNLREKRKSEWKVDLASESVYPARRNGPRPDPSRLTRYGDSECKRPQNDATIEIQ